MEEENKEILDSQNETETIENTEETPEVQEEVDLDAEIKKATAPLYARMKKAEEDAKEAKAQLAQKSETFKDNLSTKDIYALMEAKVPEEDIDEVREYATLKKVSISEALKSNLVKSILSEKAEQRQTAEAANIGASKRGTGKIPDDILLKKASKGEMPDNDVDLDRLVRLRKGYRN